MVKVNYVDLMWRNLRGVLTIDRRAPLSWISLLGQILSITAEQLPVIVFLLANQCRKAVRCQNILYRFVVIADV